VTLPERTLNRLKRSYGPVAVRFTIRQIPSLEDTPDNIREDWLGITLPVRRDNVAKLTTDHLDLLHGGFKQSDQTVLVADIEAIHQLDLAGRHDAAFHYLQFEVGLLAFRACEGEFSPK
jgi:hypothetical protein